MVFYSKKAAVDKNQFIWDNQVRTQIKQRQINMPIFYAHLFLRQKFSAPLII